MSGARQELGEIQRWMQEAITGPVGAAPEGAAIVRASATLTSVERIEVYRRSYRARLLATFRTMFPALAHALGEGLFDQFVMDYLVRRPPTSYTLGDVANEFPEHLAETRPDRDAAPEARESWPDFVIEVAAVELAVLDVSDGPGLEGGGAIGAGDVLDLRGNRLLYARPTLAPCVRLFACKWPVRAYVLAVRGGEAPALPGAGESFVALCRRDYRVSLHELSRGQHALLLEMDGSRTVGEAMARAGEEMGLAAVREWVSVWAARGFFAALGGSGARL